MARALSPAEQERALHFRIAKRRRDWLLGRVVAKRAACAAFGARGQHVEPRAFEIASAPDGHPYARRLAGEPLPIAVSISHSGGCALGAAAWHDEGIAGLGIDLEALLPRSQALVTTFFTPLECSFVAQDDHDLRANLVWCAKEAVLKALAVGLTIDTRAVECRLSERGLEFEPEPEREAWHGLEIGLDETVRVEGRLFAAWRSLPGFVAGLAVRLNG